MAAFIRCPECGFCIGKYAVFVEKAREALSLSIFSDPAYSKHDPDTLAFSKDITPRLDTLFAALEINNRCCRTHLSTNVQHDKQYA